MMHLDIDDALWLENISTRLDVRVHIHLSRIDGRMKRDVRATELVHAVLVEDELLRFEDLVRQTEVRVDCTSLRPHVAEGLRKQVGEVVDIGDADEDSFVGYAGWMERSLLDDQLEDSGSFTNSDRESGW